MSRVYSSSENPPVCKGDKTVQPTQGSGFYYVPRVILKLPFKTVTVRFKDSNLQIGFCKLMAHRIHLACRDVLFTWNFFPLILNYLSVFKIWEIPQKMPDVQILWENGLTLLPGTEWEAASVPPLGEVWAPHLPLSTPFPIPALFCSFLLLTGL